MGSVEVPFGSGSNFYKVNISCFQTLLSNFSFPAYTMCHLGISVERLFATLTVRRYEHTSTRLSSAILTCIGLASGAFTFYISFSLNFSNWLKSSTFKFSTQPNTNVLHAPKR